MPSTWTCEFCDKIFTKPRLRKYRFCSQTCATLHNKPSQALLIPEGKEMSLRTKYRRRAAKGETQPVFRYPFNEEFFFTWSDPLAWLLGIIWTDGYLYGKGNSVEISSIDFDLMEMIESLIEQQDGIRPKNKGRAWRIVFSSPRVIEFLMGLGLTTRKSKTIEWPTGLPAEYEPAFVRGVIDGDGWISLNKKRPGQQAPDLAIGICGASIAFRDALTQWFAKHSIRYSVGVSHGIVWRINISAQASLRAMYPLLYPAGDGTFALIRKHAKYLAWLEIPRIRSGRPAK